MPEKRIIIILSLVGLLLISVLMLKPDVLYVDSGGVRIYFK